MASEPAREELEAECCWEPADIVPARPEMTAFRRRLRLRQARWREAEGHPAGTQPIVPNAGARPVGSRVPLDHAAETGANFVTPGAWAAVQERLAVVEPHQSLDRRRLLADLLWAPALAANLFGDLRADVRRADRAVKTWWPDTPGRVAEVKLFHSPGWLDPSYLNTLCAFDAAVVLDLDDGRRGLIGIDVKYHDWLKPEEPKPANLPRYCAVAARSGAFVDGFVDIGRGRQPLTELWIEHLLALSTLQHESGGWGGPATS